MTRVSSHKIRQYVYVVGTGLDEDFNPEHIELYMEDGSPLDIDATDRMRWRGVWDESQTYSRNDVVTDDDNLYILVVDEYGPVDSFPGDDPEFWDLISVSGEGTSALIWRGTWNAATAYAVSDAVTYNGASYRRVIAGTTATSPNADLINWEMIAGVPMTTLEPWHLIGAAGEPAFKAGWSNYTGSGVDAPGGFRKYPDGTVKFKGMLAGSVGGIMFTLPLGYRPPKTVSFPANTSGGLNSPGYIQVFSNGDVAAGSSGSVSVVALDVVHFDTDTIFQASGPNSQPLEPWRAIGAAGEPAFQGTWANYASGFATAAFRKDPSGRVHLRGTIKSGAASTVAFVLPAGYRPPAYQQFPVVQGTGGASGHTVLIIEVGSNGNVAVYTSGATTAFVDLGSISFDTDSVAHVGIAGAQQLDPFHIVGAAGEPAFQNGWTAQPGYTLKFRKDPFGQVHITGVVKPGVAGTVFTLPAAYAPALTDKAFIVLSSVGNTSVSILANGNVVLANVGYAYAYLDDISFDTESVSSYMVGTVYQSGKFVEAAQEGHVLRGGGGSISAANPAVINGASGIVSVTRMTPGRFKVVTTANALNNANLWPRAQVADTAPCVCQCIVTNSNEYDIYVLTTGGVLVDGRTVYTDYKARVA